MQSALQPVSSGAWGKIENITELTSDAITDAEKLFRHAKRAGDSKRLPEDSANKTLPTEGFEKKTVKFESALSV